MLSRVALGLGSLYGMTGVMLGAMGAHALKGKLSVSHLASFQVGARYQLIHALLLVALGILAMRIHSKWLKVSVICIGLGVLCFSGSIYALVLLHWRVGLVTPLGGVLMIAGWAFLFVVALQLPEPSPTREAEPS